MRQTVKKLVTIVFVCMLVMFNTLSVQAATDRSRIKKLVNQMDNYEYSVCRQIPEKTVIKLMQREKARAAALSLGIDDSDGIEKGEFGGYVLFKLDTTDFKKASLNMFGKKLPISSLPDQPENDKEWRFLDAYLLKDGMPVVYCTDAETECDFVIHSIKIRKKSAKTYLVTKKLFCGYWGYNDGSSNYKITYTVQKNSKSAYGFVITKMALNQLSKPK